MTATALPYWAPGVAAVVATSSYVFVAFGLHMLMLFSAICIVLVLALGETKVTCLFHKFDLFLTGFITFVFSHDKSMKKERLARYDPGSFTIRANLPRKRLVFIRHGESEWNAIFNKSKLLLLPRLIVGIVREVFLVFTRDSIFIDANLGEEGLSQVHELNDFIEGKPDAMTDPVVNVLRGESGLSSSIIVSSNLRRAIATCVLGLRRRLKLTREKVHILSDLQEISRNVDANALAGDREVPDLHRVMDGNLGESYDPDALFDVSLNHGQKPISSNGLQRTEEFLKWAFQRPEDTIIVGGGHSLWFKNFFKTFLPRDSKHHSISKKMHNCGVVVLDVVQGDDYGKPVYCIIEDSIKSVYKGFQK
eukprot:TRINITY_DN18971_c0_g1_i1.p1 TRINITY_DN18971_c0_g1~~TRINITY_DN18971_c0_g1_i1.p1  ORF type:complete len:398 (+),score=81.40 TRINITY_DN18971_c0_g1_i1:104-1195(+)